MTLRRSALLRKKPPGYIIALIVSIACFYLCRTFLVPRRVGDGTEYYGLYFAWLIDHRPFMTPDSWQALAELVQSGSIREIVPTPQLAAMFPALHLGATTDFNHFWMYSLLAAAISGVLTHCGIAVGAHTAFLLLHAILLGLVTAFAWHVDGRRGLLTFVLLTILSPMVWYVDKVHTEFFTYCLCSAAVISLCDRRYFLSSLCLALASTQNISFAGVALAPLILAYVEQFSASRFKLSQVLMIFATGALVFLHPLYYFFRYGKIDPQFVAGGATVGGNLKNFYVWLLDLDIGLLPNWPLGLLLVVLVILIVMVRKPDTAAQQPDQDVRLSRRDYLLFCSWFLFVSLYAQSSTDKLNSGATPGLARYATWYIPLFYPALRLTLNSVAEIKRRAAHVTAVAFVVLAFCVCAAFTLTYQRPQLSEAGYITPSPASLFVQSRWPFAYNPPPEIFAKRYSGIGEAPELRSALAIVGPDCKKVLISNGSARVFGLDGCGYDEARLLATIRNSLDTSSTVSPGSYMHLSNAQARDSFVTCPSTLLFSTNGSLEPSILRGFSTAEPWGRWALGRRASIVCLSDGASMARLTATSFSPAARSQHLVVSANGAPPITFTFLGPQQTVDIPLRPSHNEPLQLDFSFPDAASPRELGVSDDERDLSIGFVKIDLTR
ncbi:hypothetical protein [Paraburkholderia terrae]|uniref:Uncharacterized protein n=1 Tax=Paraburkholderia terrae TaxID=311230 RepID=A0A2I8ELR4_9BURK|nr:hypothetical protein [Paraburkholderia terrae]AUT60261.1 hypothetical protein C2L65_12085 [Paraburkholderia terrae]